MNTTNFERNRQKYKNRMTYIREHDALQKLLSVANRLLTGAVYVAYPVLLAVLLAQKNSMLAHALFVPLDSFVVLSVVRYFINRKRPYEVYDCKPAIHKEKKGESFPSRHVFSVFVIAMTFWGVGYPAAGAALFAVGVCVAAIRVYSGVHFFSDVVVGAAVGIASGLIGFWGI